jgi:hypothetical protein
MTTYRATVEKSVRELQEAQVRLGAEYRLFAEDTQWQWNQKTGTISFRYPDGSARYAHIAFVGSVGAHRQEWLWAWANDSVSPEVADKAKTLRRLAETRGWPAFDLPSWPAIEKTAWEVTAIAVAELGGIGAYRTPIGQGGTTYMVLLDMTHSH